MVNLTNTCFLQYSGYSTLLEDLQRDSDEEGDYGKTTGLELPLQENVHFKKFTIMHRLDESRDKAKQALVGLEKEALLLDLIPIAFNDELDKEVQFNCLFTNTKDSINIIWDFILVSFRFFGEPTGLYACYFEEFKRLDKFYIEHSTLPMAESEVVIDLFRYCVNINNNLLGQRDIEIGTTAIDTSRGNTDVVMEETVMPRVTGQLGSTSLNDLILSPAEEQMTIWKPDANKIMQQFQEYNNDGYDITRCLGDVVQSSKLRFTNCSEVHLFGLKFTESPSIAEWAGRSIENYAAFELPKTFEELQNIPLDKHYNFLMSMDRNSINKEIQLLGIEALMFWELPKVNEALNEICQKWFFNYNATAVSGAIDVTGDTTVALASTTSQQPTIAIVGSAKEKKQCVELGFVDKLIQLWRIRKSIYEAKTEISVSGTLAKYNYKAGDAIMNKTLNYKSTYMHQLFKKRNQAITEEERRLSSMYMYENYLCQYKALLLQCERDFDLMINVRLYQEIVLPYFTIRHGQFAAVALVRSGANKMLRKVWVAYITKRDKIVLKEHNKTLQIQRKFDAQLENAQLSAGQQIDNRIDQNLAGLDAKVKSIIKDTVKSHSIKREAIEFDQSLLECDLTRTDSSFRAPQSASVSSTPSAPHSKKARRQDYIDLRSPSNSNFMQQQTSGYSSHTQGF